MKSGSVLSFESECNCGAWSACCVGGCLGTPRITGQGNWTASKSSMMSVRENVLRACDLGSLGQRRCASIPSIIVGGGEIFSWSCGWRKERDCSHHTLDHIIYAISFIRYAEWEGWSKSWAPLHQLILGQSYFESLFQWNQSHAKHCGEASCGPSTQNAVSKLRNSRSYPGSIYLPTHSVHAWIRRWAVYECRYAFANSVRAFTGQSESVRMCKRRIRSRRDENQNFSHFFFNFFSRFVFYRFYCF